MRTHHTVAEFEAQGLSSSEALSCWYMCWQRDALNALNKAIDDGLSIVLNRRTPKHVSEIIEVLRDSAGAKRSELRWHVADYCAPWFEVHQ